MKKIEWNDSLSVGNTEIDEQHKRWVEIYNEIHEEFKQKTLENSTVDISETLKAIVDYTRYHFASERKYMKKIDYPDIVAHLRLHKEFDDRIYKISREISDDQIVLPSEIMTIIKDWFLEHIVTEDKKYCRFLQEK